MNTVLLVVYQGLTGNGGLIPLRDLYLVDQSDAGRETLLYSTNVASGFADAIAAALMAKGVPVEDVHEPLPGLEKTEAPKPRRTRRKPKEESDGTAETGT